MSARTGTTRMPLAETSTPCCQLDITVHDTLNEIVHAFWLDLLASLHAPTLFQHPAWHEAFIASRYQAEEHGQLLFVTVTQGGQPNALLPLSYRKGRRFGLPARIVELMFPTDMGVRDFPIRDDIDAGTLLHTVLTKALPQAGYPWDIAELNDLVTGSAAFHAFQQLKGLRKLSVYHHDSNQLKCSSEPSQPFAHVSKSHIKKTQRKRKNFDALGSVNFELVTDFAVLPQALDLFIELENAGWKGSAGEKTSLHHDLPQKAFYESLIDHSAPNLRACFAILRLDSKPVAVNLCTRTGDTLWMLKITYADDLHDYSPGNLILLHLLEQFAGDTDTKYISFITGGEWTLRWHPEQLPVANTDLFAGTLRGQLLARMGFAKQEARRIKHSVKPKPSNHHLKDSHP